MAVNFSGDDNADMCVIDDSGNWKFEYSGAFDAIKLTGSTLPNLTNARRPYIQAIPSLQKQQYHFTSVYDLLGRLIKSF